MPSPIYGVLVSVPSPAEECAEELRRLGLEEVDGANIARGVAPGARDGDELRGSVVRGSVSPVETGGDASVSGGLRSHPEGG